MAQIGTIRVDTQNNGTVSVPVFDTGDSGSSIYEFVRVQTGSGTGFIPVEDTSNATYPYLRVQSQSHGTVAMTDRNSSIPDSGLLHHYDWSDPSTTTSTVSDLEGNNDLTGTFTDLNGTINDLQAGTFDGQDDLLTAEYDITNNQPFTRFVVCRVVSSDSDKDIIVDGYNVALHTPFISKQDNFRLYAGSNITAGTFDKSNHIHTLFTNGTNSEYLIDGSVLASGDVGNQNADGIAVGARGVYDDQDEYANVIMGEIAEYDTTVSGYSRSDILDYFSNKWGISLS